MRTQLWDETRDLALVADHLRHSSLGTTRGYTKANNVVSLFLAWAVDPGFGLIGIYLPLVNAIMHIRQAVRSRSYNPGLVTAVVLFLPASAFGIWAIQRAHYDTFTYHLVGLGVVVLIHVALMVYVRARRARLSRTSASANS